MDIVIVDYDAGNIGSVLNSFQYLGYDVKLSNNFHDIEKADALVLPGVGSFDAGISSLKKRGVFNAIKEYLLSGRPYLGICLGLQMLFSKSDEGREEGFGIIDSVIKKFQVPIKEKNKFKIPQIGWNSIDIIKDNILLKGVNSGDYFYFVHSYYSPYNGEDWASALTDFIVPYVSFLNTGNIFATQFHPEKSQKKGLRIIKNFCEFLKNTNIG